MRRFYPVAFVLVILSWGCGVKQVSVLPPSVTLLMQLEKDSTALSEVGNAAAKAIINAMPQGTERVNVLNVIAGFTKINRAFKVRIIELEKMSPAPTSAQVVAESNKFLGDIKKAIDEGLGRITNPDSKKTADLVFVGITGALTTIQIALEVSNVR